MGGLTSSARGMVLAAALASAAALPGCIVSGSRDIQVEGKNIGAQTLSQIEPGKTDKNWVLAVMGEPTRRNILPDDAGEVWIWKYRRVRDADTKVLLLFHGDKRSKTSQTVYVQFDGDIVQKAWRDRSR